MSKHGQNVPEADVGIAFRDRDSRGELDDVTLGLLGPKWIELELELECFPDPSPIVMRLQVDSRRYLSSPVDSDFLGLLFGISPSSCHVMKLFRSGSALAYNSYISEPYASDQSRQFQRWQGYAIGDRSYLGSLCSHEIRSGMGPSLIWHNLRVRSFVFIMV
jgi:hypothetical protein